MLLAGRKTFTGQEQKTVHLRETQKEGRMDVSREDQVL